MDRDGLELHLAVAEWQPGVYQAELSRAGVVLHVLQSRQNAGACGRTFYSLRTFWKLLRGTVGKPEESDIPDSCLC